MAPPRGASDSQPCCICSTTRSSSFRRDQATGARICNSCHCKLYRRKRKAAALAAAAERPGHSDGSASSAAALHHDLGSVGGAGMLLPADGHAADGWEHGAAIGMEHGQALLPIPMARHPGLVTAPQRSTAHAGASPTTPPADSQLLVAPPLAALPLLTAHKPVPPHPALSGLQWQALEEEGVDRALTLQCARHAQAATSGCLQRTVLGVLPRVALLLPQDPAGMRHTVSCLLEAVQPEAAKAVEQEADSEAAATAAAAAATLPQEQQQGGGERRMTTRQQQARQQQQQCPRPALRLTVFGAAGAVVRSHQAPAAAFASPTYGGPSGGASWSSGHDGFTLAFPGPPSTQLELFNAILAYAASVGPSALLRATIELSPAAAPPPATPFAALPPLHAPLALGTDAGCGQVSAGQHHWVLPSPLASHEAAQAHSPHRAPTPPDHHLQLAAREQHAAAAAEAARQQRQQADAAQWHTLQALLSCEPALPLGGHATPGCGGYAAGPADADLGCLGMDLTLACSLPMPTDALFDAACLDFIR